MLIVPLVLVHGDPPASASPAAGQARSGDPAPTGTVGGKIASRSEPASATTAPRPTPSATPTATDPGSPVPPPEQAVAQEVPVRQAVVTTTTSAPPTTTTTTSSSQSVEVTGPAHYGEVTFYDHPAGTCASPWLPFGTVVEVTNPDNGSSATCVVDDREADTDRSIDLATSTFAELAPLSQGVIDAQLRW